MKSAFIRIGVFLLEVASVAVKSAVATTVVILTARYFKVLWL